MWMNACSTMVGASTLVSTLWAATSAAAKRASSSAITSTRASTAPLVSLHREQCVPSWLIYSSGFEFKSVLMDPFRFYQENKLSAPVIDS